MTVPYHTIQHVYRTPEGISLDVVYPQQLINIEFQFDQKIRNIVYGMFKSFLSAISE